MEKETKESKDKKEKEDKAKSKDKKIEKKESKIRERSGSKEKIDNVMIEVEQASKKVVQNDLLLIRTQQGFHEK